jgi:hypothetical protein
MCEIRVHILEHTPNNVIAADGLMPVAAAGLVRIPLFFPSFQNALTEPRTPTVHMLIARDVITRGDPITGIIARIGLCLLPRSDWGIFSTPCH